MVRAAIFNAVSDLVIIGLLSFVGLALFAYYTTFPEEFATYSVMFPEEVADGTAGDRVLPYFIMQALPNGVSGLLITAIFASACPAWTRELTQSPPWSSVILFVL